MFPKCNQQDATFSEFIYFNKYALHVSGGSSAHHQELKLYIQLLVFVILSCYPGWDGTATAIPSQP
jgi:hypothetical protein